jgi:hypothetical protein
MNCLLNRKTKDPTTRKQDEKNKSEMNTTDDSKINLIIFLDESYQILQST